MPKIQILTTIGYVESARPSMVMWSCDRKYAPALEYLEELKNLIVEYVTIEKNLEIKKCCPSFKGSEGANYCSNCGVRIVDPEDVKQKLAYHVRDFLEDLSSATNNDTQYGSAWEHFNDRGWSYNCNMIESGQLVEIDQFDEWILSDPRFGVESTTWYGELKDSKISVKKK